jgi:hypothetical protein
MGSGRGGAADGARPPHLATTLGGPR